MTTPDMVLYGAVLANAVGSVVRTVWEYEKRKERKKQSSGSDAIGFVMYTEG